MTADPFPPGLSRPALRALAAAGITRLEDLSQLSEAELLRLHGVGPKALTVLVPALRARGLSFAGSAPPARSGAGPVAGRRAAREVASRDPLDRLRALCLALPEAHEVEAWGEPTFRVRGKLFVMYAAAGNHHGAGRPAAWLKDVPANQEAMVAADPGRFFVPPYVGKSGWVGVWLDRRPRWKEVAELVRDAYRRTAPKRLLAGLPDERA